MLLLWYENIGLNQLTGISKANQSGKERLDMMIMRK
jgi:hypothetical protein